MSERNRIFLLILIMATSCLVVMVITIRSLYQTALAEERLRLVETAQSQARLIEAIARFDSIYSTDYPGGSTEATLSQITDAHKNYTWFGKTGEFTLAKREKGNIVFLLSHRHYDLDNPKPIPFLSELAEPMRLALANKSGTTIGLDYRRETVLAAYEPLRELKLGIVAKIDLSEIKAPFVKAGLRVGFLALLVVLAGSALFIRISSPMIKRLEKRTDQLLVMNEQLLKEIEDRKKAEDLLTWELDINASLSELYEPLISPSASLVDITTIVMKKALKMTGSKHGYVSSIDSNTGDNVGHTLTKMMEGQCDVSPEEKIITFPIGDDGRYNGLWGHSLNTSEAFYTNSPKKHPASKGLPEGHIPIQRLLSVPVILGKELVGQICLANKNEDYTDKELNVILRLAGFYALALQRQQSREALQEAHDELEIRVEERTVELRESNEVLENIFSTTHFCIVLMDTDFNFIKVNRAYSNIGDNETEFFSGKNHFDLFPDEENESIFRQVAETGEPYTAYAKPFKFPHDPVRGVTYWDWTLFPMRDAHGKIEGLLLCLIEVTERIQAEEALRNSDLLMRNIYNSLEEAVFVVSPDRGILKINVAAKKMFGYEIDELKSQSTEILHVDHEHYIEFGVRINEAFEKNEIANFEFEARRKDGKIFPTEHTVSYLKNEAGEVSGIVSVVRDISKRKLIEEQLLKSKNMLEAVFDGISDPLIMLNKDLHVGMLNKSAAEYYDVEFKDAIGKHCYSAFKGGSAPCEGCKIPLAVLDSKQISFERNGFKDSSKTENVVVYPLRKSDHEVGSAIIRINDITKTKMMERSFYQNEKLAALGFLVSGIAHEINNPNNFISFNIPILKEYLQELMPIVDDYAGQHHNIEFFGMSYPEFRKDIFSLLDNVEHGSRRINITVSGLKDFSRKKDQIELRRIDLKSVITRGVSICRSKISRMVKSFDVEIPEDLPLVYTDPEILEQIIINILINAAQAADKEDSWVKLKTACEEKNKEHMIIEVSDNGCGMDGETIKKIFDPFFTTKPIGEGTGLGLSVCYNLVQILRGRIEVESKPGQGSKFRIILENQT